MNIKINKKINSNKGLIIVSLFKDEINKLPSYLPQNLKKFIQDRVKDKEFKGKAHETYTSHIEGKEFPNRIFILGRGEKKKNSPKLARELGADIGKYAKNKKFKEITIFDQEFLNEIFEGLFLSQYEFNLFKTKKEKYEISSINLISQNDGKKIYEEIQRAKLISEAMDYIKNLVNSPCNVVDTDYMVKEAKNIAKKNSYKIEIFNNTKLEKDKFGGILAVNRGSEKGANLIILKYFGAKDKKEKPIELVGKGVMFDSGGYNLKPVNHVETMQQDMAGGATVLGIFSLLKKLEIQKNVIGIIPTVENMINEKSYKPSDILTMYNGKTLEITNTDAEGRIILADAVSYGAKLNPELMITVATLTGAVAVALGDRYCGLMGNNDELVHSLKKAGDEVDDLGWQLPLHDDYREKLRSHVADYRNYDLGSGRYGGCLKGAAFIEKFVGKNKWAHIDIGGTAFADDPKRYQQKGATAHSFRMLLRFLEK